MKKAILLVSHGAGNPQSHKELKGFEERCKNKFPQWTVRWAFTSDLVRSRLASQRQKSDSVFKALMRLNFEHFRAVAVQPLQVIPGREYAEVHAAVQRAALETGAPYAVGAPLLTDRDSALAAASALQTHIPADRLPGEDVIFMGHGARHEACRLYPELGGALSILDAREHLGIMSGKPGLSDILPRISSSRVWLLPLLSTIGVHTLRDMAGEQPTSWKSRLELAGAECRPVIRGIIQARGIAAIWLERLNEAVRSL